MSPSLTLVSPWITHPDGGDSVIYLLTSPGLWPGETIQLASWGAVPVTIDDVKREARTLGRKTMDGLRSLKPRDVADAAASTAATIAGDAVLHSVGSIEPHQSVADIGPHGRSVDLSSPPEKSGYILALTSARLLILGVATCITDDPRAEKPVRWYALHDVTAFSRPLPESIDLCFSWVRVLWERQLDLSVELNGKRQTIRFNSYGIANAIDRACAIARSVGRDPGP